MPAKASTKWSDRCKREQTPIDIPFLPLPPQISRRLRILAMAEAVGEPATLIAVASLAESLGN